GRGRQPRVRASGGRRRRRRDGEHDGRPGAGATRSARLRGLRDHGRRERPGEMDLSNGRKDGRLRERDRHPRRVELCSPLRKKCPPIARSRPPGLFLPPRAPPPPPAFLPPPPAGTDLQPPRSKTEDVKDTYGAVEVADPYRWLEDQKAPDTRAWIDEQN